MSIKKRIHKIMTSKISHILPDSIYLQMLYFYHFGHFINLKNPQTYNEKIQWLKLYYRDSSYSMLVDKYRVKDYVSEKIGNQYVIPTLGVWHAPEEIDFDKLPKQFVLKWNHDSGSIVICTDKDNFDREAAIRKLQHGKEVNGFWYGREWPYKNVEPVIIAEEYMEDKKTGELRDYKFFCFNGDVKALFVASDRQNVNESTKFDFFDMDFNHLDIRNGHPNSKKVIQKPDSFETMKELASELSKGFCQVRIDFYEVDGKPYFGEITLYHGSGMLRFDPQEWDEKFGEWVKLPPKLNK